jgi:type IV fimbrial biogenesis protein FimT
MPTPYRPRHAAGHTLVELLAALAVSAALFVLALPGFDALRHRLLLASQQQDLLTSLRLARTQALLRGARVELCPGPPGGSSACDGSYQPGWLVYVDVDRNRAYSDRSDQLLRVWPPLADGVRLTDRGGSRLLTGALGFLPDGSARRSLTLRLCSPAGRSVASRSTVLSRGGRLRTRRDADPCPGEST